MSKQINFIDLFCGCGGWTEGMVQQGLNCIYSVDNWAPAAKAHSLNHPGIPSDAEAKDILDDKIFQHIKDLISECKVDLIIGSPPCTQFSFANRGGNGNTVEGMVLVRRFLELIDFVQNKLNRNDIPWVMENVPRLKNFIDKECVDQSKNRYRFNYIASPEKFYTITIPQVIILNSADFGAPQKRLRAFCGNFNIPKPTHCSPEILEKGNNKQKFLNHFKMDETELTNLRPWKSLGDILSAFPKPSNKASSNKLVTDPNYPEIQITEDQLTDHFYDTKIHAGIELYEAHELKQHHAFYGVMQFPDNLDNPARTLMATEMRLSREAIIIPSSLKTTIKTSKRSYEDILKEHYSPDVGGYRRLTIRESASLMGFPITFQFEGKNTTTKHKQLGNAVSPQISNAFAQMFEKMLCGGRDSTHKIFPFFNEGKLLVDLSTYDYTNTWTNGSIKKQKLNFRKHLRCTKYNGQRVDLCYNHQEKSPKWEVILCTGSGKTYSDNPITSDLLHKIWSGFPQVLGVERIERLRKRTQEKTKEMELDTLSFTEPLADNMFNPDGSIMSYTPLYYIERGINDMAIQIIEGQDITSSKKELSKIFLSNTTKNIDLFVAIVIEIAFGLREKANLVLTS